ncbi:hypothetical protein T08_9050 [Trichinella sp. T8]|nr:hypothetical protein T08_9050 [Trichinella sp. T8]
MYCLYKTFNMERKYSTVDPISTNIYKFIKCLKLNLCRMLTKYENSSSIQKLDTEIAVDYLTFIIYHKHIFIKRCGTGIRKILTLLSTLTNSKLYTVALCFAEVTKGYTVDRQMCLRVTFPQTSQSGIACTNLQLVFLNPNCSGESWRDQSLICALFFHNHQPESP